MRVTNIQSCHLGPEISPEQFISDHFFLYLLKGSMTAYDGKKHYQMQPGDCCIARKNHLIRYTKYKDSGAFEKVVITLDELFLKQFSDRHSWETTSFSNDDAFLTVEKTRLMEKYIQSLEPYYNSNEELEASFADVKREELLLILLKTDASLANVFFNFGVPQKIDLEAFMLKNFRFNLSLARFAYLTGRSLSTFKRDFEKIFHSPPALWIKKKRLTEAFFLLSRENKKPGDIYLDLGFEDLSHFSFSFKKEFGKTPSEVTV